MTDASPISLRDIAYVVFRYKYRLIALFLSTIIAAVGYLLYVDPIYEAETKILVLVGKERFSAIESYNDPGARIVFQERGENVTNEMEILLDKQLTDDVYPELRRVIEANRKPPDSLIKKLKKLTKDSLRAVKNFVYAPLYYMGLMTKLSEDEALKLQLRFALEVEFLEVTDIIRVTFRWSDPQFAAYALNLYVKHYLNRREQVWQSPASLEFYSDQIALYRDTLEKTESEIERLRRENGISALKMQRELALTELSELEQQLNRALLELNETEISRQSVLNVPKDPDHWIETPSLGQAVFDFASLAERYFTTLAERNSLLDRSSVNSREVQELDLRLRELREEKARILLEFMNTRLSVLNDRLGFIERAIAGKRTEIERLDASEKTLHKLERDKDVAEAAYVNYVQKFENMRLADSLDKLSVASVRIISPASPPLIPSAPIKWIIMSVAAALGAFLSFGYAVVAHFFDHTFRSSGDVERVLELPTLATVPRTRT